MPQNVESQNVRHLRIPPIKPHVGPINSNINAWFWPASPIELLASIMVNHRGGDLDVNEVQEALDRFCGTKGCRALETEDQKKLIEFAAKYVLDNDPYKRVSNQKEKEDYWWNLEVIERAAIKYAEQMEEDYNRLADEMAPRDASPRAMTPQQRKEYLESLEQA